MAHSFQRGAGGTAVVRLDPTERRVLRQLLRELQTLLGSRPVAPDPAPGSPPETGFEADFQAIVAGLEDQPRAGIAVTPADPVLARLLPDAYAPEVEDGRARSEFRRLTEADLRAAKSGAAQTLLDALADDHARKIVVTAGDAEAWLASLNDLRLGLGVHLNVDEEGRRAPGPDDPDYGRFVVYAWLTELQGSLIELLDP